MTFQASPAGHWAHAYSFIYDLRTALKCFCLAAYIQIGCNKDLQKHILKQNLLRSIRIIKSQSSSKEGQLESIKPFHIPQKVRPVKAFLVP